MVRIPLTNDISAHNRLNTPIVHPHESTLPLPNTVTAIELSDYIPVLPNRGVLANQVIPGHNTLDFSEYAVQGYGEQTTDLLHPLEYQMTEPCILEFLTLLRASGYEISCARDIGLKPDGTPVFVDPDVVQQGRLSPDKAFAQLMDNLDEIGARNLFKWRPPTNSIKPYI